MEFQIKRVPSQSSLFCTIVPTCKIFRDTKCMALYDTALKKPLKLSPSYIIILHTSLTKKKREKNWLYLWNGTMITVSLHIVQRDLVKFNEIGGQQFLHTCLNGFFLNGFPSRFLKDKRRCNLITHREGAQCTRHFPALSFTFLRLITPLHLPASHLLAHSTSSSSLLAQP